MDISDIDYEQQLIEEELERVNRKIAALERRRHELEKQLEQCNERRAQKVQATQPPEPDWASEAFSWSETLRRLALEYWKIRQYRPMQLCVLNAVMHGRDVLAVMPTGGGKSLCYQLPALITPGITLVISPLVALIQDQVYSLKEIGIEAFSLTATTSKEDTKQIMDLLAGKCKDQPKHALVYVTPERISQSKRFMAQLEKCYTGERLARIVIDECHCCSQLGHDFRPDYKKLGVLRTLFPRAPIVALTATCPPNVQASVVDILNLKPIGKGGTLLFEAPLERPNLIYQVVEKPTTLEDQLSYIARWVNEHYSGQTGIIYCASKKETCTIAEGLSQHGISVGIYHADLKEEYKEKVHQLWRSGKIRVIVATTAFGMGIDQPHVRFVVHHSLSKSLDSYYQETGRAGRDGERAVCLLLNHVRDATRLTSFVIADYNGLDNAYAMLRYANDVKTCRKLLFLRYFSPEKFASQDVGQVCGVCDNCCLDPPVEQDVTREAHDLARLVKVAVETEQACGRSTFLKMAELWHGKHGKHLGVKQAIADGYVQQLGQHWTLDQCEKLLLHLLLEGYVKESFHFTAYSTISYVGITQKGLRLAATPTDMLDQHQPRIVMAMWSINIPENPPTKRQRT